MQGFFFNHFVHVFPELFITFVIIFLTIFGVSLNKYKFFYLSNFFNQLSIISSFFLILLTINNDYFFIGFNYMYIQDIWSFISKVIVSLLALSVFRLGTGYYEAEGIKSYEILIILWISILGMYFLLSVNDLLLLYIALEIQSLSFYLLATYKKYSFVSTEAGVKYFVLGSVASGFFLFGTSLLYGVTGTTNFTDFSILNDIALLDFEAIYLYVLALIFIGVAFVFKLGGAPFHTWVPDVYEGSMSIITAFFSFVPKIVLFFVFARLCLLFNFIWSDLLLGCGLLSMAIGTIGAFYQTKIKRIMAFGAINHVGFVLIGLSLCTLEGLVASLFYIVVYCFLSLNFFLIYLSLREKNSGFLIKNLFELNGFFKVNPVLALFFALNLFSLAGVPPLVGFYSKFYVLLTMLGIAGVLPAMVVIIFSALSSVYYIRMIKILFFETPTNFSIFKKIETDRVYLLAFLTIINVLFFGLLAPFSLFLQNIVLIFLS